LTPLDPVYGGGKSVKPSYNDDPKSRFAPARKSRVPSLLPEPPSKFALPPPLKPSSSKPSIYEAAAVQRLDQGTPRVDLPVGLVDLGGRVR